MQTHVHHVRLARTHTHTHTHIQTLTHIHTHTHTHTHTHKSPNHNFDELLANCRFTREFRDASLLCFSETWFMDKETNESVAIVGFGEPYRTDRDSRQTGKERGGGVCLYISEKFCDRASVTVKQRMCTPELELIPSTRVRAYLRHCRLCRCLRFDLCCTCWESDRHRRP